MTTDLKNTLPALLALNLALFDMKTTLSQTESQWLNDIREQLLYPEYWDIIIKDNLKNFIEKNQELKNIYEEYLKKIDPQGNFPREMQQILESIKEEIPSANNRQTFSHAIDQATPDNPEFNPDPISKDLINWSVQNLGKPSEERPQSENHNQSSWLQELLKFLNR